MLKKKYAAKHTEFMASPLLPFYWCEYTLQRSRMHFLENVVRSDRFSWFWGSPCFSWNNPCRQGDHSAEQSSQTPLHLSLTENTNPLCYKLNLEFRIHISYKENQKRIRTITKTIMVQDIGQFGWNSFKRLLTNCWKLIALRSHKIKISSYSCDAKDIRCRAKKKVTGCFQSKQHFTELIFRKRTTIILRKSCTKYVADKALVYHEITTNVYKLDNIVRYPNQRPTKTRKQP